MARNTKPVIVDEPSVAVAADPMIELLINKIKTLDPQLVIADNLTVDDLLQFLAIATNNKKVKDQLIADISKLTTNKKLLGLLPDLTISKLEETLENLKDPVLLSIKRAVDKDSISYTSFQPSKVLDTMIYIQGIRIVSVEGDPVDAAIGSVFLRVANSSLTKDETKQYFCEVFQGSVSLAENAYKLGLTTKQIKALSDEIGNLWCYEIKIKKMKNKLINDQKKQQDRDSMRENMIKAIRDRK